MIIAAAIGTLAGLLGTGACAHAAAPKPLSLPRLNTADIGASGKIHDTIVRGRRPLARSAQAPSGGVYTTADGSQPTILLSSAYAPNPVAGQSLANFFGLLLHGDELSALTVYLAPYAEMQSLCGSADADSCYDTSADTMYLVGDVPPDGVPLAEIAAHEYGHHVANYRDNSPWVAGDWGPKYWATAEHVCDLVTAGLAFPGDEDEHYAVNPGEAWAETYRVLNAQNLFSWPLLSELFAPDTKSLAAARRDVLEPWGGDMYTTYTRRLSDRRRSKMYWVPVQNDGAIDVNLRTTGSLDADVYVFENRHSRTPLARSQRAGHRDRITGSICGMRRVLIAVLRYKGRGSYRLRVTLPYTNDGYASAAAARTDAHPRAPAPRL
jgi:hypothetical protein